jgi:predicted AAA+ superfamily ATPase
MERPDYQKKIVQQFKVHPICALLGPRQVGKTTLARMYAERHKKQKIALFDLENPFDLAQLDNPMFALSRLQDHLVIIDEIQLRPNLFPILRVLADQPNNISFLILGSASRDLIRQSSETLAGRIGFIELNPLSLGEVKNSDKLWLRGGFPRSYLTDTDEDSYLWRQAYVSTFLERDIPSLGFQIPAQNMRRFWLMLAHYHGQIFNASDLGRSLGVTHHTVRSYLDILVGTFMIRQLTPWYENLSKRQVKTPKIYFRDSGLLHALMNLHTLNELYTHPKLGAFWEGFALEEIIRHTNKSPEECFFWATQSGAELDLLIMDRGKKIGFEFKFSDSPKITQSMRIACEDLHLDHLYIITPGNRSFPLDEKISVQGLDNLDLS